VGKLKTRDSQFPTEGAIMGKIREKGLRTFSTDAPPKTRAEGIWGRGGHKGGPRHSPSMYRERAEGEGTCVKRRGTDADFLSGPVNPPGVKKGGEEQKRLWDDSELEQTRELVSVLPHLLSTKASPKGNSKKRALQLPPSSPKEDAEKSRDTQKTMGNRPQQG